MTSWAQNMNPITHTNDLIFQRRFMKNKKTINFMNLTKEGRISAQEEGWDLSEANTLKVSYWKEHKEELDKFEKPNKNCNEDF